MRIERKKTEAEFECFSQEDVDEMERTIDVNPVSSDLLLDIHQRCRVSTRRYDQFVTELRLKMRHLLHRSPEYLKQL